MINETVNTISYIYISEWKEMLLKRWNISMIKMSYCIFVFVIFTLKYGGGDW